MAGLVPAIHALMLRDFREVDARDKPGHDGWRRSRTPAPCCCTVCINGHGGEVR